ncbi:MAG: hypothetical protein ACOZF0_17900 [Thermodesulfobacteriota bacterium]
MENKRLGRGLEQISDLFLSTGKERPSALDGAMFADPVDESGSAPPPDGEKESAPPDPHGDGLAADLCEVEEQVSVRKNITFPLLPDAREKMWRLVCRYLESGYGIKRIELIKSSRNGKPGHQKTTEEIVCIGTEDPPPVMNF